MMMLRMPLSSLLLLTLRPNTPADRGRLDAGLREMLIEDPTLSGEADDATSTVTIGGMSEMQLEIVIDRLRRDFDVKAAVDPVAVAYREALTCTAEGEGRLSRQVGGHGEYAHAKIRVFPGEPGSGFAFHNSVMDGTIPDRFLEPIRDGIAERAGRGVLAGYPLVDVSAELWDGSYHDEDSSESAFRIAGAMAFEDAAKKAAPVLMEPMMRVEVVVPTEHGSDVVASLLRRRGQIRVDTADLNRRTVHVVAPLSELLGYAFDLRARTGGRGTYTLQFEGYARFDPEMDGDDRASCVGAPLRPAPTPRNSAIALPEPDDDRAGI
jgi:elongation factor G